MEDSKPGRMPLCMLAHDLLNKTAAIVGYCELLKMNGSANSECLLRLEKISNLATEMAGILHGRECAVRAGILELESTFASDARYGAKKPVKSDGDPIGSQLASALDRRS